MNHNLTVDVGNTRAKLGLFMKDQFKKLWIFESLDGQKISEIIKTKEVNHSILVNSGKYNQEIDELLSKQTNFIKLSHQTHVPINNKYATPETLGKDRLCSAIGAATLQPNTNLLIIDTGTCITFNLVTAQNEYIGGSIAPGIEMRLKALPHFTHKLPLIEANYDTVPLIGNDTESSVLSGVMNGIIAETDGLIDRYRNNYEGLKVYITGGGSRFFEKQLKNEIFADPNLVLTGLNKILIHNATT